MAEDISNKTVLILLVLTILISVVGTLIVLEEANKVRMGSSQPIESGMQSSAPSSQLGLIKVRIEKPPELQGGAE